MRTTPRSTSDRLEDFETRAEATTPRTVGFSMCESSQCAKRTSYCNLHGVSVKQNGGTSHILVV